MIDLETFAREVRDMRTAQTRYFQTGRVEFICGARQREAKVDKMIREIFAGSDLVEHARACAGECTPSATRVAEIDDLWHKEAAR